MPLVAVYVAFVKSISSQSKKHVHGDPCNFFGFFGAHWRVKSKKPLSQILQAFLPPRLLSFLLLLLFLSFRIRPPRPFVLQVLHFHLQGRRRCLELLHVQLVHLRFVLDLKFFTLLRVKVRGFFFQLLNFILLQW